MGITHLFSDSPNFTPKATLLHETLKHGKGCLGSLGRGTLGGECASPGEFERITTKENKRFSSLISRFLTTIAEPFEQATGGQESRQGLPQVEGIDRCGRRGR